MQIAGDYAVALSTEETAKIILRKLLALARVRRDEGFALPKLISRRGLMHEIEQTVLFPKVKHTDFDNILAHLISKNKIREIPGADGLELELVDRL